MNKDVTDSEIEMAAIDSEGVIMDAIDLAVQDHLAGGTMNILTTIMDKMIWLVVGTLILGYYFDLGYWVLVPIGLMVVSALVGMLWPKEEVVRVYKDRNRYDKSVLGGR